MSSALALRPLPPIRSGLLALLLVAFSLVTVVSVTPDLVRAGVSPAHSQVCKCAHCSGGRTCCCKLTGTCQCLATP